MLISIVVPVYNVGKYLAPSIESVLAQSFDDFELLLVDDGSTDGSAEVCDTYAAKSSKIRVIHQPNQGVSVARNSGIEAAQGEWIIFLDGDDQLCDEALSRVAEIGLDPTIDTYLLNAKEEMGEGRVRYYQPIAKALDGKSFEAEKLLATRGYLPRGVVWGALYNRAFLNRHNLRFIEGVINSQDSIFTRFAHHYSERIHLRSIDLCLVKYRGGSASRSWSEYRLRRYIDNFKRIETEVQSRGVDFCESQILNRLVYANATYMLTQCICSDLDKQTLKDIYRALEERLKGSSIYPVNLNSAPLLLRMLAGVFNHSIRWYIELLKVAHMFNKLRP